MKKILELIVCIFHPIAVVLAWINLLKRDDIHFPTKIIWSILLIIPIVPFFYVLFSGDLW